MSAQALLFSCSFTSNKFLMELLMTFHSVLEKLWIIMSALPLCLKVNLDLEKVLIRWSLWYLESKEMHSHSTHRNEGENWKQNTTHELRWKIFTETEKENGNKNANITIYIYIYICNSITHLPPTDTLQLSENVLLTLIYAVELITRAKTRRFQGAIQVASFYFNTMLSHHWNYCSLLAKFQAHMYVAQLFPYLRLHRHQLLEYMALRDPICETDL